MPQYKTQSHTHTSTLVCGYSDRKQTTVGVIRFTSFLRLITVLSKDIGMLRTEDTHTHTVNEGITLKNLFLTYSKHSGKKS